MSLKTVSALLRGAWLIEPEFAKAHLPMVQNLLSGNFQGFEFKSNITKEVFAANTFNANRRYSNFDEAPKGSFAIIPISGPVLKHDNCGDAGSMTRARQIAQADQHDNISAIIFNIDSPGGMVDGTQTFADAIKAAKKPTIAIVNDGIAASAAYWLASQCDEVYVTRKTDMVGSIGVYLTLVDPTKAYEDKGFKIHEIYAPESTEKNKEYKEAKDGNYKPIEAHLSFLAQTFIGAVKEGRGDKLNLAKGDPFKGKMYFADEAQAIGLIDGVKSFDEVIERAAELVTNNSNNNNSLNMKTKKFAAINAVLGVDTLEASNEGVFLNEDQMDAIEAGLTPDETLVTAEDHQTTVDELATANATITSTEESLRTMAATAGVEIAEGDFNAEAVSTAINAKITELNGSSTEETTATNEKGDPIAGKADEVLTDRSYYADITEGI